MTKIKVIIALFLTIFFWSSAFIAIRIGLNSYSPGAMALLRSIIGSVCMFFIYKTLPKEGLLTKDKVSLCLIGAVGIGVYHTCLNYGEISVSAGIASFIIGLIPIFSILLSVIFLQERPAPFVWLGVFISMLGLFLLLTNEGETVEFTSGALLILIATFSGAFHTVFLKKYLKSYSPLVVTTCVLWGGTISLLVFFQDLVHELPKARLIHTDTIIYLGIFPTAIAYSAWSYIIENMSVTEASLYLYIMPIISTLMGVIVLHEIPTKISILGCLTALAGAIISQLFYTFKLRNFRIDKTPEAV